MQHLRALFAFALAFLGLPNHGLAMGSGPHPTVPYGIPLHPAHSLPNASHPSLFLIGGVIALSAILLLTALMTYAETRHK